MWASGLDDASKERQVLLSLQPLLSAIEGLKSREQLPGLIAQLARAQVAAPIAIGVRADSIDTRRYALFMGQAGLTLPDRDDYARTDAGADRLRA
ncbi:MAG: hypothetical protein ACK559_39320, partial [bacterium]